MSTIGNLTQLFADQEDLEVMINNQQNNGTSSFGIGSDSTIPPNRPVEPTNTNLVEANEGNPMSQNHSRQTNTNITPDIIELPAEQHVETEAAVADMGNRHQQVQQTPDRPREFNPNKTFKD